MMEGSSLADVMVKVQELGELMVKEGGRDPVHPSGTTNSQLADIKRSITTVLRWQEEAETTRLKMLKQQIHTNLHLQELVRSAHEVRMCEDLR